jgi:hypothetical protein
MLCNGQCSILVVFFSANTGRLISTLKKAFDMSPGDSDLRRRFYSSISSIDISSATDDVFKDVAAQWGRVTNADSCWLWIHNKYTDEWELACRSGNDSQETVVNEFINKQEGSVADYASILNECVHIPTLDWTASHNNRDYRVARREWLERLNVKCFDAFPVKLQFANAKPLPPLENHLEIVLCCHFSNASNRVVHQSDSSDAMRRVTAFVVENHIQSKHFNLLIKLNDMSRKYLTKITRTPAEDRVDYLRELSKVIQDELQVRGVSVFYRVPFEDSVACLFSTGICDKAGKIIGTAMLADAKYKMGEGRTGSCFKDGRPRFLTVGDVDNNNAKYIEVDATKTMTRGPALMCPIPRSSFKPARSEGPHADGVVRCTEHPARFRRDTLRNFDPIEAYTLQFISLQISPVLDMLGVRIAREQQVSVIKHDLEAPLFMIKDTVEQIIKETEQGIPISTYCLPDLNMASVLGLNLVSFLEAEPGEIARCEARWTFLEGEIVARNKSMLRYYARKVGDMTINFDSFHQIPQLWIDRDLVERVFLNLMINAIKYGAPNTTIRVVPRVSPGWFFVDVENRGVGISEYDAQHIFKPYYRGARAKKRKLGVGLGLYIARVAMERNGGTLTLSRLEDPTVFTMGFPTRLARVAN